MKIARREVIGVGLSWVVAGCGSEAETSVHRSIPVTPNEQTLVDPPTVSLRIESEDPLVRFRGTPTGADADDDSYYPRVRFVADRETADRMAFLADVEGQRAARSFLEETDFDRETVYVSRHGVGACYELQPCSVRWSDGDIHVQFARRYRSPDVACSTDDRHRVVTLFRIPEVIDPDTVNSFGGGTQSGGCPSRRRRRGHGGARSGHE